jgi:ppGpp synthetase/RelA/SpoT-type nucleotidyltranferase
VSDLSDARARWMAEEFKYDKLQKRVVAILKEKLRSQGIFSAFVAGRAKGMSNLLKKMLKKGYSYDRITDKAGARVVVKFRHDVNPVLKLVESSFYVLSKEDKSETLGHNKVGYSGVHYDVRLAAGVPEEDDVRGLQCEIQILTLCQSLWAEMDHELSYKPAQPIPEDLRRQIYLLNAQLEIADRDFSAISREILRLPGAYTMALFRDLERHFYRFTGETFDSVLSLQILDNVLPSYSPEDRNKISVIIEEFVGTSASHLQSIFGEYEKVADRPLLLFQPESFVLFERLERDPHTLEEVWTKHYPREELERVAIAWSRPLD